MVILLILLAAVFYQPPSELATPAIGWREKLIRADGAVKKNDIYAALAIYDQVTWEASVAKNWEALLSVACGLMKVERLRGIGLTAESVLLRAIAAAEEKRSARGLRCAALALETLGATDVATAALFKFGEDWVDATDICESQQSKTCGTCNYEA